jgi:Family of unknown function (DUF6519)
MSFDNSRYSYDHWKLYAGVVMEQGRVQNDADWNEWLAGQTRRIDAGTFDTFGHAVCPQTTPNAFKTDAATSATGNTLLIGLGRMYVDGILVENLGSQTSAVWDSALAELSNTPQQQPSQPQKLNATNSIDFTKQPFNNGQGVPQTSGVYFAYLDVWRRPVTYLEDSSLVDPAIGVDTTGRMQTVWRVNLMPLPVVTIAQKSLTGSFKDGDLATQANSNATGLVIGGLSGAGPLLLSQLSGTPNATDVWTNSGGASFTPGGSPVISNSFFPGALATGSPSFKVGEALTQNGTGATATLVSVSANGPMVISSISGWPSPLAAWVGQTSGAVFIPASLPSALGSGIAGAVTKGTGFLPGEEVIQDTTGASANVIGTVPQAGPMTVGFISGTPDDKKNWVGQTTGTVFTPSAAPVPASWNCSSPDGSIPWPVSGGVLLTGPVAAPKTGPCCMTAGVGYTGAENQLYRVEIHSPGGPGGAGATFKWSRENASVQTLVTALGTGATNAGTPGALLSVKSLGPDQVLGFQNSNWIEITDAWHDNAGLPGELYKIDHVDIPNSAIILTTQLSASFSSATVNSNAYTRIIRWDQAGWVSNVEAGSEVQYVDLDGTLASGALKGTLGIPIPADNSPVVLENGVSVTFNLAMKNASFQPMDFWNFTARASDGSISQPISPAPQGVAHHFTKLGIVTFSTASTGQTDCRTLWPPPTASSDCGCCCTVTVGDGKTSFGQFATIQAAIDSLTHGGDVSILCGDFYENVVIQDKANISIHGCGQRTRVLSPSLQPGNANATASGATAIGIPAVFSIARSRNISITSLKIEADVSTIGVLLDQPAALAKSNRGAFHVASNELVKLYGMTCESEGMPAIAAFAADSLFIRDNAIRMTDSGSLYPAVYLSGEHIWFERNSVEIRSGNRRVLVTEPAAGPNRPALNQIDISAEQPAGDMAKKFSDAISATGGVQVGGPSNDIWIVENQISGGRRNGITLGNLVGLDANSDETGNFIGLWTVFEEPCSPGGSGTIPHGGGGGNGTLAAGGIIRNLHILRNRIRDTGMCGIGPVGFFNLKLVTEVISLENVLIAENMVLHTLRRNVLPAAIDASPCGYGAISLPDVANLIVRDNIISDYGVSPGAEVCGIYIYHGHVVEISRNQISESRDLKTTRALAWENYGGRRAGIYIENVTPPPLDIAADSAWIKAATISINQQTLAGSNTNSSGQEFPLYVSGIPALRIVDNTVRVAFGLALYVNGVGPFSILGNHFATGGAVTDSSLRLKAEFQTGEASFNESVSFMPLTVMIFNRGFALELGDMISTMLQTKGGTLEQQDPSVAATISRMEMLFSNSNGTVLFANNICQLTADVSRVRGDVSVVILSLDALNFLGNELWVNGPERTVIVDAAMLGITLQTTSSRFQEAINSATYSGFTFGGANTTANIIATYCFFAFPALPQWWQYIGNTILIPALCS